VSRNRVGQIALGERFTGRIHDHRAHRGNCALPGECE
jgi:hypothetical protein